MGLLGSLFGRRRPQDDDEAVAPSRPAEPGAAAPIDRAQPGALAARMLRLLRRPGYKALFQIEDGVLRILLVSEACPLLSTIPGQRYLFVSNLLGREQPRVLVQRLYPGERLSPEFDLTAVVADLAASPGAYVAIARCATAQEPGRGVGAHHVAADAYHRLKDAGDRLRAPALLNLTLPKASAAEQVAELAEMDAALAPFRRLLVRRGRRPVIAARPGELLVCLVRDDAEVAPYLDSAPPEVIVEQLWGETPPRVMAGRMGRSGRLSALRDVGLNLPVMRWSPTTVGEWLKRAGAYRAASADADTADKTETYFAYLEALRRWPALIDFLYRGYVRYRTRLAPGVDWRWPPFDRPAELPPYRVAPALRRRSVVFLHNNYFYNNILAKGLRERGWDALTVSIEAKDSANRQFMQGEDLNLHDPDPKVMHRNIAGFFRTAPERFGVVHFTGQGMGTFFPHNIEASAEPISIPWDFMELRRHGVIVGYMPSGCLDGPRQSSIRAVSGGVCGHCVWEFRPDVCSDVKNHAWDRKLESLVDWISVEGDWAVDGRTGDNAVLGPVVTPIDPELWSPDIEPPADMLIDRLPGEVVIYHAVGNYESRRREGRDMKGTGAVLAAIERLQADGLPVKLIFATNVPSTKVKYLQVQADIVVDQLNYGRHGSNARESFMLGKPVVTKVDPSQGGSLPPLAYLQDSPAVNADEDSLYPVLKDLVVHPERWPELGAKSRAFAQKWLAPDVCALRFERIIDRIDAGLSPNGPGLFPS